MEGQPRLKWCAIATMLAMFCCTEATGAPEPAACGDGAILGPAGDLIRIAAQPIAAAKVGEPIRIEWDAGALGKTPDA